MLVLGFVSFFHQLFEVTGDRETRFAAGIVERNEPCSGQTLEAVAVAVDTTVLRRMRRKLGDGVEGRVGVLAKLTRVTVAHFA